MQGQTAAQVENNNEVSKVTKKTELHSNSQLKPPQANGYTRSSMSAAAKHLSVVTVQVLGNKEENPNTCTQSQRRLNTRLCASISGQY